MEDRARAFLAVQIQSLTQLRSNILEGGEKIRQRRQVTLIEHPNTFRHEVIPLELAQVRDRELWLVPNRYQDPFPSLVRLLRNHLHVAHRLPIVVRLFGALRSEGEREIAGTNRDDSPSNTSKIAP